MCQWSAFDGDSWDNAEITRHLAHYEAGSWERSCFSPPAVCLWSGERPPAPRSARCRVYCWLIPGGHWSTLRKHQTQKAHLSTCGAGTCRSSNENKCCLCFGWNPRGRSPSMEMACSLACTACSRFLWLEKPCARRMCVNRRVCLSLGMLYMTVSDSMISDGLSEI